MNRLPLVGLVGIFAVALGVIAILQPHKEETGLFEVSYFTGEIMLVGPNDLWTCSHPIHYKNDYELKDTSIFINRERAK